MAKSSGRHSVNGFIFSARSAEHGFTVSKRSAEHGFTLVELMVVITLVALLAAAVVVNLPDSGGRLRDDAERFAARARAAHDLAIVEARTVSLWVSNTGYGFDIRSRDGWTPITDKPFRAERWTEGTRPRLDPPDARSRVIFDTTGLADAPLNVALDRPGAAPVSVAIGTDGSVAIHG